ncbi:MAG: hypothetical protein LBG17_07880 [Bacteroidales bacterium]|nr:hypothetical protein [Bacteroidales bacterium]
MKHIMKTYFGAAITAGIMLFTACEKSPIDDMTGKYPPPTDYALTKLFAQQVQKLEGKRIFTLKIATDGVNAAYNEQTFSYTYTGTGNYISIDFVGKGYFLEAGAYNIASNEIAKAGNYIAGYDAEMFGQTFKNWGTCFFNIVDGAETGVKVTDGTLSVTKDGDNYTISGVLALEDGKFIRVNYSGEMIFPEDPPVYTYTVEIDKPYQWTMDGTNYTPVAGSQLNKFTVLSDGLKVAYFEIVTAEDIASYSGTYPVSGEIRDANGAVVQGIYLDLSIYQGPVIEGGSYLFIDDENEYISAGDITINDNNGTLTFTSSNIALVDKTTGQPKTDMVSINYIDATISGSSGNSGGTHSNLFSTSALDLSLFGSTGYTVTLKVATPDLTVNVEAGSMGPTYTYEGSGQYISFDFSRDAGTLPAGTYNVVDNTTAQVGDCIAGYNSLFGTGFMGTFVGNVVDGAASEEVVTGGTVTVTDNGFSFNLTTASGTIEGSYVGNIVITQ